LSDCGWLLYKLTRRRAKYIDRGEHDVSANNNEWNEREEYSSRPNRNTPINPPIFLIRAIYQPEYGAFHAKVTAVTM
jgi:hypothetical protein